jgi:hypothetical protein
MKSGAKIRAAVRRLFTAISVSPFRLAAFTLHATGLEHVYKPQFNRHAAFMEIDDELVARLPKHDSSLTGGAIDPINLIFVGQRDHILTAFKAAGWHGADPSSPLHLMFAGLTVLLRRPYHRGALTPHFVNIGTQDLSFQKLTKKMSFSQRHHLRVWRTGITLGDNKPVWVAAATYDSSLKVQLRPPFIHHRIEANIDKERQFVLRSLQGVGAVRIKSVRMTEAVPREDMHRHAHDNVYYTDGRAVVVEI